MIKLANVKLFTGEELIKCDVRINKEKVDKLGEISDSSVDKTYDLRELILIPPPIDLHTHVYYYATSLGVNPNDIISKSGLMTLVDAGSSGAGNFMGLRKFVIEKSETRIYAFINIAFAGIPFFGVSKKGQYSDIPNIEVADVDLCRSTVQNNLDIIVGVKVRLSGDANGELGIEPLKRAKDCAKPFNLPVMVHFGIPPPDLDEIIPYLEKGDILTHTFRPEPNSILNRIDKIKGLKNRGVIIDVGHGRGSFSFTTARKAIEENLLPDTISTDIHKFSIPLPVIDLYTTMSKFLHLGMDLQDILKSVTINPAKVINRQIDGKAEFIGIEVVEGKRVALYDSEGKVEYSTRFIIPKVQVKGEIITPLQYS